jgi:hypothetical protein
MNKLICLNCKSEIGIITKSVIELTVMKSVSKIDIELSTGECKIKCSKCNEWNAFTNDSHRIDLQRKSKEVMDFGKC